MSSFTAGTASVLVALAAAGSYVLGTLLMGDSDTNDYDELYEKYDTNDDGTISKLEMKSIRRDFKSGQLSREDFEKLTGSASGMQPLLVGLAAVLVLLILLCFGRRIWANIFGVFAPKPHQEVDHTHTQAPSMPAPSMPAQTTADADKDAGKDGPFCLEVEVIGARNLPRTMHFTRDKPYVACKSASGLTTTTKVHTAGDFREPEFKETLRIAPWRVGEGLEFDVLSKGLLNSKKMGSGFVPGAQFYPSPFAGEIDVGSGFYESGSKLKLNIAAKSLNLPTGWEAALDSKSGDLYYYNRALRISQWDMPKH